MEMTTERKKQIEMAIQFFNMRANTRFKFSPEKNQIAVNSAIEAAGGEVGPVRLFFKDQIAGGQIDLIAACDNFVLKMKTEKAEVQPQIPDATPIPAGVPEVDNNSALNASMAMMGQIIAEMMAKTRLENVEQLAAERLRADVQKFIIENYGPIQRRVEIQFPDKKVELQGIIHSKFDVILSYVQANEPVFLTGPAGSGKNVLCQQVAKALGLNFYFSNAVTQEHKITGFTDAMGVYHESQFYKAFKNGGLFMLDEMDASIPEVLVILNAAIANRYFDFPAPIGYVEAHPDFRVVAAGNTFGAGADYDYVGRNQLDAASLDRFGMVRVDYDPKIEEGCANGDTELLNFCRKFREATRKAGIRTVVSYRAISRMAKLSKAMEPAELLDSCLIKALDVDDLNAISNSMSGCGKYTAAFFKIRDARKAGV